MNNATDSKQNSIHIKSDSAWNLLELAVLASSVAGLLYFGYFQLAPWIWSQNVPFDPREITPWTIFEMK